MDCEVFELIARPLEKPKQGGICIMLVFISIGSFKLNFSKVILLLKHSPRCPLLVGRGLFQMLMWSNKLSVQAAGGARLKPEHRGLRAPDSILLPCPRHGALCLLLSLFSAPKLFSPFSAASFLCMFFSSFAFLPSPCPVVWEHSQKVKLTLTWRSS